MGLQRPRVYLSSTYADLSEHRARLLQALRSASFDVESMETYAASDERPADKCIGDVADCDAYVGVFARRYGYMPTRDNPAGHSITEMEYREATRTGRKRFIFLLDTAAPWPAQHDDRQTGDGDHGRRIEALRDELSREHIVSFFRTADELVTQVLQALATDQVRRGSLSLRSLLDLLSTQASQVFWGVVRVCATLFIASQATLALFGWLLPGWAETERETGNATLYALLWGIGITLLVEAVRYSWRRRRQRQLSRL